MKNFLEEVKGKGDLLGLESVKGLFDELGNPQNDLPCIQVAGTNGKGSTCAFLSSILKEAGYKVGVYTSPQVFSYYERFCVNGVDITEEEFYSVLSVVKSAYERLCENERPLPTIFEVETACAVLFFKQKKCDFIIMEAGMGGDLDATNVFKEPLMAIFAPIGVDHVEFLGDTVEKIAEHKSGLIKANETVVSAQQPDSVKKVFSGKCNDVGATIAYSDLSEISSFSLGLPGEYQKINAANALCATRILVTKGYKIDEAALRRGLKNAKWKGRFEKMTVGEKEIRLDGAHNVPAAQALVSAIKAEYKDEKMTFVLGMLADKDCSGVVRKIMPVCNQLITVTPDSPRALEAEKLAKLASEIGISNVTAEKNMEVAVKKALNTGDKTVIIAGSFTILGEIKSILEKK